MFVIIVVLLPTRSEERGVLEIGSIPVAIPPSCQDETTALIVHKNEYSWVVKVRNIPEATILPLATTLTGHMGFGQYNSIGEYCSPHTASSDFVFQ